MSLVRNVSDDEDDDGPELTTDKSDTVTEEAARWAALDKNIVREYVDDNGCHVRGSPCDAQREILMNGIRLQA